jgi:hypothetical protein
MEPRRSDRGPNGARRGIGRRAIFFWVTCLVCVALVPAMPAEFRWVAWTTAGLAFFWAALLSAEDLLGPGGPPGGRFERKGTDSPFGPPPPPGRWGD